MHAIGFGRGQSNLGVGEIEPRHFQSTGPALEPDELKAGLDGALQGFLFALGQAPQA